MSHIGKHKFQPERTYGGRCGAVVDRPSPGHQVCCGREELAETHNVADCDVCRLNFTPVDEPVCPRCKTYVEQAFRVLMRRAKAA